MFMLVLFAILLASFARLCTWALGEDWQAGHYGLTMAVVRLHRWSVVAGFGWVVVAAGYLTNHVVLLAR